MKKRGYRRMVMKEGDVKRLIRDDQGLSYHQRLVAASSYLIKGNLVNCVSMHYSRGSQIWSSESSNPYCFTSVQYTKKYSYFLNLALVAFPENSKVGERRYIRSIGNLYTNDYRRERRREERYKGR